MTAEFWVFVSFVIFVVLAFRKVSSLIATTLDGRAARIRQELDEAQRLREDAQATLASYQRRQRDAAKETETLLAGAREDAERLRQQAGRDLEAALKRREAQALDRIAQAEAAAVAEVRNLTVDVAIAASRRILEAGIPARQAGQLIEQSIAQLPKHLH
ncbi:F0F1 ATP synthase subunit B [Azospirillum sp. SYSU D00513]|uniref:F0F1 ATP synthase subunit B family protein n=1 Tax=Azospirillum sp. SYSU D00513 TaxID=2812561 RepID=UPI001A95CBAC|nr:F0F1 ATP synthase subunit B [Azospirillum sp. SYSU D00513]